MGEALIDEKAAAEHLGVTVRSMQTWRVNGKGPKFVRISRTAVRYRPEDVKAWVEERIKSSTSEP